MELSTTLLAGFWGWLAASSLLLGAAIGYWVSLPPKVTASIMAYGSGVLIAALCFGQFPEAERLGGLGATLGGMVAGGVLFVLASQWLDRWEAHHRARNGGASSMAALLIAVGAFLDGIPESLGLGLGLLDGGQVSLLMLVAIFLSNLPEGLASAAGLARLRPGVLRRCGALHAGGYADSRSLREHSRLDRADHPGWFHDCLCPRPPLAGCDHRGSGARGLPLQCAPF